MAFPKVLIIFNPAPDLLHPITMIYFTTLILTLLFAHIARAVPGCGDDSYSEEVYDTTYDTYDDGQVEDAFPGLSAHVKVTWDATYDNPHGNTLGVACSNGPHGLAAKYPHFKNFPGFPYLGGAFDTKWGSEHCGRCWKLVHKKTGDHIFITVIDASGPGTFNIAKHAFKKLNGGTVGAGTLEAVAHPVSPHPCP
jgi:cerato-platanin